VPAFCFLSFPVGHLRTHTHENNHPMLALTRSVSAAHAQTWEQLRTMRKETTLRI